MNLQKTIRPGMYIGGLSIIPIKNNPIIIEILLFGIGKSG
jgi:hypothetical protein